MKLVTFHGKWFPAAPIVETREHAVVVDCPGCCERHTHGIGSDGHKVAHCAPVPCRDCGEEHPGGVLKWTRNREPCTPDAVERAWAVKRSGYVVVPK